MVDPSQNIRLDKSTYRSQKIQTEHPCQVDEEVQAQQEMVESQTQAQQEMVENETLARQEMIDGETQTEPIEFVAMKANEKREVFSRQSNKTASVAVQTESEKVVKKVKMQEMVKQRVKRGFSLNAAAAAAAP